MATETYRSSTAVQHCGVAISTLPNELLMQVFVSVPSADVVRNCSKVCKLWLQVARDPELWSRKCKQEGRYVPGIMGPPPEDFMQFYFRNPYTRNLLKNTTAQSLLQWYVQRGFPGIEIEEHLERIDPIAQHVPPEELGDGPVWNWVTSYRFCSMRQRVDLLAEGCSTAVLDDLRPPIQVSAWCGGRRDCDSRFQLLATLRDEDHEPVEAVQLDMEMTGELLGVWHKVDHTFRDYKAGVRTVEFVMGGCDTKYWAGIYGAKFTLPSLRFVFNKEEN